MIGTAEQDEFVGRSMIAIATTIRTDGSPSSSMVSFVRDGDALYFTTTTDRLKGRMLARDPRLSLTILNAEEPWSFVVAEGSVVIHEDNPASLRALALGLADRPGFPWSRADIEQMITAPGRAMYELQPARVSGVVMPRG